VENERGEMENERGGERERWRTREVRWRTREVENATDSGRGHEMRRSLARPISRASFPSLCLQPCMC
jgi:hypothetical protein